MWVRCSTTRTYYHLLRPLQGKQHSRLDSAGEHKRRGEGRPDTEVVIAGISMSTMRFCRECNNILYPKEDMRNRVLYYACRSCDHQEVADSNCVYWNVVDHAAGEFTQVLYEDVSSDPTLPRTRAVRCAACGHGEATFFQSMVRTEEDMTLFFVCCNPSCGHKWRE